MYYQLRAPNGPALKAAYWEAEFSGLDPYYLEDNVFDLGTGNIETLPQTDLAKKYDGYKYSVAPLKQTCETIMVFKKPNKTGSVLHDTLAMVS